MPDGRTGEMDAPYIADPDYITLFERAIVILEHQRIAIGIPKNFMISNYAIQGVSEKNCHSTLQLPHILIPTNIKWNLNEQTVLLFALNSST